MSEKKSEGSGKTVVVNVVVVVVIVVVVVVVVVNVNVVVVVRCFLEIKFGIIQLHSSFQKLGNFSSKCLAAFLFLMRLHQM